MRLLNTTQAAEYLGYSPRTLANWRYLRIGPTYSKPKRKVHYRITDLDAFLEESLVKP